MLGHVNEFGINDGVTVPVTVTVFTIHVRRIYPDHLPGRFTNSWLKRQAAPPPARSRRPNVCGDGEVAMTNQIAYSADSTVDGPDEYFWQRDVQADLTMPLNFPLKRIQPGQQAAKEPQC